MFKITWFHVVSPTERITASQNVRRVQNVHSINSLLSVLRSARCLYPFLSEYRSLFRILFAFRNVVRFSRHRSFFQNIVRFFRISFVRDVNPNEKPKFFPSLIRRKESTQRRMSRAPLRSAPLRQIESLFSSAPLVTSPKSNLSPFR